MKIALSLIAAFLVIGQTSFAQTALKPSEKAILIAKAIPKLNKDSQALLTAALLEQSYDYRVSITESECKYVGRSMAVECEVTIGTDDMNDDDRGWGTLYKLNIRSLKGEVVKAQMKIIAG